VPSSYAASGSTGAVAEGDEEGFFLEYREAK